MVDVGRSPHTQRAACVRHEILSLVGIAEVQRCPWMRGVSEQEIVVQPPGFIQIHAQRISPCSVVVQYGAQKALLPVFSQKASVVLNTSVTCENHSRKGPEEIRAAPERPGRAPSGSPRRGGVRGKGVKKAGQWHHELET